MAAISTTDCTMPPSRPGPLPIEVPDARARIGKISAVQVHTDLGKRSILALICASLGGPADDRSGMRLPAAPRLTCDRVGIVESCPTIGACSTSSLPFEGILLGHHPVEIQTSL